MFIPTAPQGPSRMWFWLRSLVFCVALAVLMSLLLPTLLRRSVYEVRDRVLIAHGVLGRAVIPADTSVREVTLTGLRRVAGTALPGYCTGTFQSREYRRLGLVTSCSPEVLVFATPGRATAISPADPAALLSALRSGEMATFFPATRPRLDASLIGFVAFMLLPLAMFFVSPRLTYRVEKGELKIRTFTNTFRFPVSEVTASLTTDHLGAKLFGTGIPGYYTGTYALSELGKRGKRGTVQTFATTNKPERAVLVRHKNTAYYLTPADPENFLRLLAQESVNAA